MKTIELLCTVEKAPNCEHQYNSTQHTHWEINHRGIKCFVCTLYALNRVLNLKVLDDYLVDGDFQQICDLPNTAALIVGCQTVFGNVVLWHLAGVFGSCTCSCIAVWKDLWHNLG